MKHLKKLILFITCFVVLLSSFSVGSFSVDQDMIDEGWIYDNGDYYMPGDFQFPSLLLTDEPNYPNFDPNKIPWEDAPNYIKEILYNTPFIPTSEQTYINPWKIPFVVVVVGSNTCVVYVGVNLMLGTYFSSQVNQNDGIPTGTYVVCEVLNSSANLKTGVEYACCYTATFNSSDYEVVNSWVPCSKESVGDRFTRFSGNIFNSNVDRDIYCYGGNNIGPGKSAVAVNIYTSNNSSYNSNGYPRIVSVSDASAGFGAGASAIVYAGYLYSNYYVTSFVPETIEDKQLEVNKGIWSSIKDLPSNIANSIKSFFTNLGDRISGFFENLKNYLLYFQETKPEHVNPFNNILAGVKSFFDEQMSDVGDFKNSLNSTLDNVVTYIESGSGVINSFLSAVPVLSAFVTFFVVFCIVRKVVGR